MKKVTENIALQKVISQKLLAELNASPEARSFFADIGNHIQKLQSYCTKVTQSLQNRPLLDDDEPVEVRLAGRLNKLQEVFEGLTALTDPNSTLTDEAKKTEFSRVVDNFNQVLGGYDFRQQTTFSEDVNLLLNEVGYEKLEDAEMNTLFQLAQTTLSTEMTWQSIEANISVNNALRQSDNFLSEKMAFETKKKELIDNMYETDPELTGFGLGGRADRIRKEQLDAEQKLTAITTKEYAKTLKDTNTEVTRLLADKERQIREEEQELIRLRNEAEKIKNAEEYGLDALNTTGIHNLKRMDDDIANLKTHQKELERELDFTKNAQGEVKKAAAEKQSAQKSMSSVLKKLNIEKEYNDFAALQRRLDNARTAMVLLDELMKGENKPLHLPALSSKGLIKGFSAKLNPKDYTENKLRKVDKIAEDYIAMKKCLCGAVAPNPDGTMSIDAPEEFFKAIDKSGAKLQPIGAIYDKYRTYCEEFVKENLHRSEQLAYMYYNKLSVDGAAELKNAEVALKEATEKLDAVEVKKEMVRTEESILAEMEQTKTDIDDSTLDRKNYAEGFLTQFHAEKPEHPESIPPEELVSIGKKAYEDAKLRIGEMSDNKKIAENRRICNELQSKINETSTETYLADIKSKRTMVEQKKAQYQDTRKMLDTYNDLPEEYEEIRKKQVTTKAAIIAARGKDRFRQLADGLAAANDHILDATRAISHTNTEEFERMKGSLNATVALLRDGDATNEQKRAKLDELHGLAQEYIAKKNAQTRLFGGSTMRRARLAFANQIFQLSGKAIQQDTEFKASEQYRLSGNRADEADMKRYRSENDFYIDFKAEQEKAIAQKKQQTVHQEPNIANPTVQRQKNTEILSHI